MIGFPLLLVPFAIYNMIAFLTPGVSWSAPVYTWTIPFQSGATWMPTVSDAFLVFSLLMLMFEFIKSTRQGKSFVEHFLSLLLAGGAAAEFWMVREGGNSTFFLFTVICFVGLFAGFAASLRRARRAVVVPEPETVVVAAPARAEKVRVEPAPARVEPAPARIEPANPFTHGEPANPFTRVEPAPPAELAKRPEPAVKIEPVQKVGS